MFKFPKLVVAVVVVVITVTVEMIFGRTVTMCIQTDTSQGIEPNKTEANRTKLMLENRK